jgi:hypothetical protein
MRFASLVALVAGLAFLAMATPTQAQGLGSLETLRSKASFTGEDTAEIHRWLVAVVNAIVTNQDPDRRGMVSAREALVSEGRKDPTRSPAFLDAIGPDAVTVIKEGLNRAVGVESRVNLLMALAELRRVEAIPLLQSVLEKEPYPASRYWAAKGLALVADVVVEKTLPRIEAEVSETIGKAAETETSTPIMYQLFETLSRFDHQKTHEALADAVIKLVQRTSASDPLAVQIMDSAVKSLQKAYSREPQPEVKQRLLMAYATMCVWVMPPTADPALLPDINSALEQITGEKVGFSATDEPMIQKVTLLEWVERFVKDKRIAKRPTVPPSVESSVKDMMKEPAASGGM